MIDCTVSGTVLYAPRGSRYYEKGEEKACMACVIECDTGLNSRPVRVEVCYSHLVGPEPQVGKTCAFRGEICAYPKTSAKNGKTYAQLRLICE